MTITRTFEFAVLDEHLDQVTGGTGRPHVNGAQNAGDQYIDPTLGFYDKQNDAHSRPKYAAPNGFGNRFFRTNATGERLLVTDFQIVD